MRFALKSGDEKVDRPPQSGDEKVDHPPPTHGRPGEKKRFE